MTLTLSHKDSITDSDRMIIITVTMVTKTITTIYKFHKNNFKITFKITNKITNIKSDGELKTLNLNIYKKGHVDKHTLTSRTTAFA